METLTQCEYQVANEVAKGQTPDEIADLLKKSVWTIKAQIRDIHKKLGINNNVELTLYMLCDRTKRNLDMRRLRVRSGYRVSTRMIRPKRDGELMFAA